MKNEVDPEEYEYILKYLLERKKKINKKYFHLKYKRSMKKETLDQLEAF